MNSLYFSHDYTASEDVKMLFLRQKLGMEGIGIFWYIIEKLAQSGGNLPIKIIPVLAMQMHITECKVKEVINDFELFVIEEKTFHSERLNNSLNFRKNLSDAGTKGATKRWNKEKESNKPKLVL